MAAPSAVSIAALNSSLEDLRAADGWKLPALAPLELIGEDRNRRAVQMVCGAIIVAVTFADWWIKPYVSPGLLYLFPIMLAAVSLPRWAVMLLGVSCAVLAELLSSPDRSFTRLSFEALALAGCGLLVAEFVLNRRIILEAQNRFRGLVEMSPAAVVTVDEYGFIELASHAAIEMMAPVDGKLAGAPIAAFLPDLHRRMQEEKTPKFKASIKCRGYRGNQESFPADVWLSTYQEGQSQKLAAIIADATAGPYEPSPEQGQTAALTERETAVLQLIFQGAGNREIARQTGFTESAVRSTLQQLFAKTNVRTRTQLVRIAFEHYRGHWAARDGARTECRAVPARDHSSAQSRRNAAA